MNTRTKLVTLKLLGGIFRCLWIVASIGLFYSVYMSLAHGAPWIFLSVPVVAGLVAWQLAASISSAEQRLDYVGQLMERGFIRVDAEVAWYLARNGEMNLLSNLHQIELADEIDRLESALGIQETGNKGD